MSGLEEVELTEQDGKKVFKTLIDYLKKQDYIKEIKLAVITDTPKTMIFPFLGEEQERELKIKPFATMEAAVNWVIMGA